VQGTGLPSRVAGFHFGERRIKLSTSSLHSRFNPFKILTSPTLPSSAISTSRCFTGKICTKPGTGINICRLGFAKEELRDRGYYLFRVLIRLISSSSSSSSAALISSSFAKKESIFENDPLKYACTSCLNVARL
jgi:hypothetical protein